MDKDAVIGIIINSICEVEKSINGEEIDKMMDGDLQIDIDSLTGMILIVLLEERLGVSLPDDFLTSENCSSLNKIIDTYFDLLKRRGIYV